MVRLADLEVSTMRWSSVAFAAVLERSFPACARMSRCAAISVSGVREPEDRRRRRKQRSSTRLRGLLGAVGDSSSFLADMSMESRRIAHHRSHRGGPPFSRLRVFEASTLTKGQPARRASGARFPFFESVGQNHQMFLGRTSSAIPAEASGEDAVAQGHGHGRAWRPVCPALYLSRSSASIRAG